MVNDLINNFPGIGMECIGSKCYPVPVNNENKNKSRESKPKNCPSGTKPIDKYPGLDKDAVHDIKDGIGNGPRDWTGITPNGDVISGDHDGNAVNHGPLDIYLP